MTDCLMAKVTPYVTDCVVAELEKLGPKYRVALRIAQQLERLPCQHKGTYADDCIVNRIKAHKVSPIKLLFLCCLFGKYNFSVSLLERVIVT